MSVSGATSPLFMLIATINSNCYMLRLPIRLTGRPSPCAAIASRTIVVGVDFAYLGAISFNRIYIYQISRVRAMGVVYLRRKTCRLRRLSIAGCQEDGDDRSQK